MVLAEVSGEVWDGRSLPVPIEEIAEQHFGLLIREVVEIAGEFPGLGPGNEAIVSGALIPKDAEIWVDATEVSREPRRRRYTVAHELGHWVLHRGPDETLCGGAAIDPARTVTDERGGDAVSWAGWTAAPGQPQVEWEADVFGGALLLPPWLVQEVWDEHHSVGAIAEAFDCPFSAAGDRWQEHYAFARSG